jgi:large subunit ribosomal protein L4
MATKTIKTSIPKAPAVKKTVSSVMARSKATKQSKSAKSEISPVLDPRVFAYPVKEALLTQVLHVYRDNSHQDTSKVKSRGELTHTTKKMYKQKGTGNARHGSRMSPTFVGGGVVFGPTGIKPGNLKLNKKMRAAALAGILSLYAKDHKVEIVTAPQVSKPSASAVKSLFTKNKTLLVYHQESPEFIASVKNLANLSLVAANQLNLMNVVASQHLAFTQKAVEAVVARVAPLLKSKTK